MTRLASARGHLPPPPEHRAQVRRRARRPNTHTRGQAAWLWGGSKVSPSWPLALGRAAVGQARLAPCWPPPGLHAVLDSRGAGPILDKIPGSWWSREHPESLHLENHGAGRMGRQNCPECQSLRKPHSFKGRPGINGVGATQLQL